MKERVYFFAEGLYTIGGEELSLEGTFSEQERHLQAYSLRQATFLFAKRFSLKLGRKVYIGDAEIYEVDPPRVKKEANKKIKEESKEVKEEEQLKIFE